MDLLICSGGRILIARLFELSTPLLGLDKILSNSSDLRLIYSSEIKTRSFMNPLPSLPSGSQIDPMASMAYLNYTRLLAMNLLHNYNPLLSSESLSTHSASSTGISPVAGSLASLLGLHGSQ